MAVLGVGGQVVAVGKRLRFQIFRRDNFACRYCGATAKDGAVLEVDHLHPVSDGGSDCPTNLVTACESCNSGKSDIALDAPVVADVPAADFEEALEAKRRIDREGFELPEWIESLDTSAAVAWTRGWVDDHPTIRNHAEFGMSFALAVATRHPAQMVIDAAYDAGQQQDGNILAYLPPSPRCSGRAELERLYSLEWLPQLIPWEQPRMIWRAVVNGGGRWAESVSGLIDRAELAAADYIEEGRDSDELLRWLRSLPGSEGSRLLVAATRDWDDHCQGARRDSAFECRDEVLDIAIGLALKTKGLCR